MKMLMVILLSAMPVFAANNKAVKDVPDQFVIYAETASTRFIPSGYMGDFSDIRINQRWNQNPGSGKNCIQVTYSAERKQNAGWAGVYWQHPTNNWGDKKGGYNLTGYQTLTFMARGEKGGEYVDKFMIGGITGLTEEGDSGDTSSDAVELTKEWKSYSIDLKDVDLAHIIGGFGFVMNADTNSAGAVFYLDEIRLLK